MESFLYKGIIVDVETPAIVKVWIPAKQATPIGQFEYLGDNVGGNLDIELIRKTAIRCRVMTPLASGAWWQFTGDKSIPGNKRKIQIKEQIPDYNNNPNARPETNQHPAYQPSGANPVDTLTPVGPLLGQVGGFPVPPSGAHPPGNFPKLTPNQHVLVAFVNSSLPLVLGTLPTDLEFEAAIGE